MARESRPERTYRRHNQRPQAEPIPKTVRWYCLAVCVCALASALAFVWCRSEQERLGRRMDFLRHQCTLKVKEIDNLRMEREAYWSGTYILPAVNRFKLNLRPAAPGPVRRMAAQPPAPELEGSGPGMLAAKRDKGGELVMR